MNNEKCVNRNDLHKDFSKKVYESTKIDFAEACIQYAEIGNTTGTYPDTLLLFVRLIQEYPIKKVLELGSGMSTLFLAKACLDKGIKFISHEEQKSWLNLTKQLLERYEIPTECLREFNDIHFEDVDLLFLDCSQEVRNDLLNGALLKTIPIIIVDDCQALPLSSSCLNFMNINPSRKNFYVWKGAGRLDRHNWINYVSFLRGVSINLEEFLQKNLVV